MSSKNGLSINIYEHQDISIDMQLNNGYNVPLILSELNKKSYTKNMQNILSSQR